MQNTWLENRLKKYVDEKTAGGGGAGLPEVTEADDGRVLGVDDGEWKAVEQASPYDAVVYIYHSNNSADDYDITIEKGDFSSLTAILDTNRVPNILVYVWDEYENLKGTTSMVAVYYYDDEHLVFRPKIPTSDMGGSNSRSIIEGYDLQWYSDNSLVFSA